MSHRYRSVLLFGAPGVGKGTQGKRLGKTEGFVHIATGDMFRGLCADSDAGREFLEYSSQGELVPDELTVRLFVEHILGLIDRGEYRPNVDVLVLDGIPRSLAQAEILDSHIDPLAVLHMRAPDMSEMIARMKRRAEEQGRVDDSDETVIKRRFEVYEEQTSPVLDHYPRELIFIVDCLGTMDEVTERIHAIVGDLRPV